MKKHTILFLIAFAIGATLALVGRTALHTPHKQPSSLQASTPAAPAHHQPPAEEKPVNQVCAICGMKVDLKYGSAVYKGKKVGFGCGACPATFAANPERYGPAALENRVAE